MELTKSEPQIFDMIQDVEEVITDARPFIEANTFAVSLEHLRTDCIIPVFAKDNETTISHYQFISESVKMIKTLFNGLRINEPEIRVSHRIKGRTPSAIGKPAKDLLENEKTIYYERCAFVISFPDIVKNINRNNLMLSIGGVRSYNQENLYSKKSAEKFKMFVGFKNMVCTNMCITTDGLLDNIRVFNPSQLKDSLANLLQSYSQEEQLIKLERLGTHQLSKNQFAHLIGKLKMYQHLPKQELVKYQKVNLNDSQLNTVVKGYYQCPNFGRNLDGSISLWNLYNLFTEANKSSYIDSSLERNVSMFDLADGLGKSKETNEPNWFLH